MREREREEGEGGALLLGRGQRERVELDAAARGVAREHVGGARGAVALGEVAWLFEGGRGGVGSEDAARAGLGPALGVVGEEEERRAVDGLEGEVELLEVDGALEDVGGDGRS